MSELNLSTAAVSVPATRQQKRGKQPKTAPPEKQATTPPAATKATPQLQLGVVLVYEDGKSQNGLIPEKLINSASTLDEVLRLVLNQLPVEDLNHLSTVHISHTPASTVHLPWLEKGSFGQFRFAAAKAKTSKTETTAAH